MSKGVNKVIIVGNLGQDPEIRTFPDGGGVTNVSIATSESWKDKATGQPQERTEWHRVVFRGRLAEIAAQYLRKGSKVYVEGSLHTRKWQNAQGQDQYTTEIIAHQMQMLDAKEAAGHPAQQQSPQQAPVYQQPAPQQAPRGGVIDYGQMQQQARQSPNASVPHSASYGQPAPGGFDDDLDIPF